MWSKNKVTFYFYQKIFIYSSTFYIAPFKVIPLRYYTLVLALFHRCSLHLLNCYKYSSFHRLLQFWDQEKVATEQIRLIWCLRHHCDVVSGEKKERWVRRRIIVIQNPSIVFPQFQALILIDQKTLWLELMMHKTLIGTIGPWFRLHNHITTIRHQL